MSNLDNLIATTDDTARELIKHNLLDLLKQAKSDSEAVIRETGEKIETWLAMKANGELDTDELEALVNTRRRVIRQFLNSQEIKSRARLEKISLGLVDYILNKALDKLL